MAAANAPNSPNGSDQSTPGPSDEWSEARSTIERFDGYLNDLRKYGFGLVTTLLAISGYLSSTTATTVLTPVARLVVTVAILTLVVAIAYLDGQYRALQRGAMVRARVLEQSLNLDLTSAMSHYVQFGRFSRTYFVVYGVVAASTAIVGIGVVWRDWLPMLLVCIAFVVAVVLIWILGGDALVGTVDWSVNAKIVNKSDPVHVTFTNLQRRQGGKWIFAGCVVEGEGSNYSKTLDMRRTTTNFMSQTDWVWPTDASDVAVGLYRIIGYWHLVGADGKPVQEAVPKSTVRLISFEFPRWSPGVTRDDQPSPYVTFDEQKEFKQPINPATLGVGSWPSFDLTVQVINPPPSQVPTPPPGPVPTPSPVPRVRG